MAVLIVSPIPSCRNPPQSMFVVALLPLSYDVRVFQSSALLWPPPKRNESDSQLHIHNTVFYTSDLRYAEMLRSALVLSLGQLSVGLIRVLWTRCNRSPRAIPTCSTARRLNRANLGFPSGSVKELRLVRAACRYCSCGSWLGESLVLRWTCQLWAWTQLIGTLFADYNTL